MKGKVNLNQHWQPPQLGESNIPCIRFIQLALRHGPVPCISTVKITSSELITGWGFNVYTSSLFLFGGLLFQETKPWERLSISAIFGRHVGDIFA